GLRPAVQGPAGRGLQRVLAQARRERQRADRRGTVPHLRPPPGAGGPAGGRTGVGSLAWPRSHRSSTSPSSAVSSTATGPCTCWTCGGPSTAPRAATTTSRDTCPAPSTSICPPSWRPPPPPAGVRQDGLVIAYDDTDGAPAARLVWMLRAAGHEAAVLDGGLSAWDGPLERTPQQPAQGDVTARPWPASAIASIDEVADG